MEIAVAAQRLGNARRSPRVLLALIFLVSASAMLLAMRHTSTTFDEIVFVAGGARGYNTGLFDLAPDHPPLMQYVYGLPVALSKPTLPDESGIPPAQKQQAVYRYHYAEMLYYQSGNDPQRIAFLGRIPAVLIALGLTFVTFLFVRRHWGEHHGVIAAALIAFTPDVLAHGGVAYSDLPVTLAIFAAAWAIDEAVRSPSLRRGVIAGVLSGLAVSVKITGAVLAPLALALIIAEAISRYQKRERVAPWLARVMLSAAIALIASYLVTVAVYRGDFLLHEFRYGLEFRYRHMTLGHGASAFLLGRHSQVGWWYFFPVAFLFKTSAGLHVLLAVSIGALAILGVRTPRQVWTSGLRVPALIVILMGIMLVRSSLDIGFRYAMPVLPALCVIAAVGTRAARRMGTRLVRGLTVAALAWAVLFPLSYYPHFLSFISEYGPSRDRNYEVLVDSNLDWGQGLLELRDFMRDRDISRVYLSYFGSAHPEGYGINYVPLPSFFPLRPAANGADKPEYVVISATNLQGVYLPTDPFARFRQIEPDAVLGHTLFVYHIGDARTPNAR